MSQFREEVLEEVNELTPFFKPSFYRVIKIFIKYPHAVVDKVMHEPQQKEYVTPLKHLRVSLLFFFAAIFFANKLFPGIPIQTAIWTLSTGVPKAVYETLQDIRASVLYEASIVFFLFTIGLAVGLVTVWLIRPKHTDKIRIFLFYAYSVGILASTILQLLLILKAYAAQVPKDAKSSALLIIMCLFIWPAIQYARFFKDHTSMRYFARSSIALFIIFLSVAVLVAAVFVVGFFIYLGESAAN